MMKINPPTFDLHEHVTVDWNEKEIKGRITDRRYYLDQDFWEYEISGSGRYFPTSAICYATQAIASP